VEPDERWERGAARFWAAICAHAPFLADFVPFATSLARRGERAALGQLLLRLTCPGVPDIYGGDELWYLALVDPDNRRPIDWDRRRDSLAGLDAGSPPTLETIKLWLISATLALRSRRPASFAGPYAPLAAGPGTCAFLRGDDVLVAVPLRRDEPEFECPPGRWLDVLPGIERCLGGYRPRLLERRA
jgi:(1->4)-alpha-D-glucan 1-alpha-D-glucosylmutase